MDRASNFPTEPFASNALLLDALKRVSLQAKVTPAAALKMARFVEASAKKDLKQGHAL